MSTHLLIWIKWSNSLKDTSAKTLPRRKRLNRPLSIKGIESIINNFSKQKTASPHRFTGKFKHLRKKLCQFYTISSRRQKQRGHLLTHYPRPTLP